MKRFTFIVIDDEPQFYERFINLLQANDYLREGTITFDFSGNKGWNSDKHQSLDFRVLTSEFRGGEGFGYTFCEALERFKEEKERYDFYVFDLRFIGNIMDPTDISNGCPEALPYKNPGHGSESSAMDQRNRYAAGLSFFEQTRADHRLKIIYSADSRTVETRISIIQSRGRVDTHVIQVDPGNYSKFSNDARLLAAFSALDKYFHRRQLEIIANQTINHRKELIKRVNNEGKYGGWDTDDIRDNADKNSLDECWSLRTLFPKQINTLEKMQDKPDASKDIEPIKQEIIGVLRIDWRHLVSYGFLKHPQKWKGVEIEEAKKEASLLDFQKTKEYKPLTSLPDFGALNLRDIILKAKVAEGIKREEYLVTYYHASSDITQPPQDSLSIIEYFLRLNVPDHGENKWFSNWDRWAQNFGIYPVDIAYISHIIFENSRHLSGNTPVFSYDDSQPCGKHEGGGTLVFRWSHSSMASEDPISPENPRLKEKLNSAKEDPMILTDNGFSDIAKIVCWRYDGTLEFWSGYNGFRVERDNRLGAFPIARQTFDESQSTEVIVTLHSVKCSSADQKKGSSQS